MTPKQVKQLITDHPKRELFGFEQCGSNVGTITTCVPISKTTAIRYARFIVECKLATYGELRSELGRYLKPEDAKRDCIGFYFFKASECTVPRD